MSIWKLLMLLSLTLFAWQFRVSAIDGVRGFLQFLWRPQMRTWLTLMGASLASQGLFHFAHIYTASVFVTLNLATAIIILLSPKTGWQTVIGGMSGIMALVSLGFMLGMGLGLQENISASPQQVRLYAFFSFMGLVQALLLIAWGAWRYVRHTLYSVFRRVFPVLSLHHEQSDKP